ncbi:MAG: ATP-binding protein, partial [Mogibacterium sp.]|nr:ATP-binding protein [Mogibacterium sp.]
DSDLLTYPGIVNATTALSGKELAFSLNFPKKSVVGLPVLECAEFGRNVVTYDNNVGSSDGIHLGNIFHMNHEEPIEVSLSANSLTSHAFITGSTGSGKSNTIYQILNQADKNDIKYLVVEPAKGEYKAAFGNHPDVNVYGTNPKISEMLKINPFSFDSSIHVLEHVDRLVEIFNVCWPMYAAMPAVLKDAVIKSYEDCGWNLRNSTNKYNEKFYPSFADVARNVKTIIETSEYDTENKGAYKGSLLTRLQSLTNGLNGLIFSKESVPDKKLFDEKTIVDLSRVGSSETKSLIMGLLVLKLQEYRVSSDIPANSTLRHITVLEEAHNILKRTSSEQSSETANLRGKSVEMISNAIAEMRTYGEGFIIADQAPGLLDMAAIRNTNTKIIMRLPDQMDRELVGYAANLNEDQIKELAKLPCGVAAIYQNEWVQPILCKIERAATDNARYVYEQEESNSTIDDITDKIEIAELLSNGASIDSTLKDDLYAKIESLNVDDSIKVSILNRLDNPSEEPRMTRLAPIYNALFPEITDAVQLSFNETHDPSEWTNSAEYVIRDLETNDITETLRRDMIQCAVTYYLMNIVGKIEELERWNKLGEL